jgi:hypothetical protein
MTLPGQVSVVLNDNHVTGGGEVETGCWACNSALRAAGRSITRDESRALGRPVDWITRYDTDDRAHMGALTAWTVAAEGVLL